MDGKKKKRRRVLHTGVLILGAYMLFLGGGTLIGELGAIILLGEREWITFARAVMGAVFTGLGAYAVWDSIRDLWLRKEKEDAPPLQFTFTDTAGVCSSNVTPERIHEQIGLVEEKTSHIALQLVTPIPAAELGELINMTYVLMEDGWFLVAVFRQDGGVQVRRKSAGAAEAEAVLLDLTAGSLPDFSAWERLEAAPRQRREFQFKRRLILYRDNGTSDHEFFTERDLDLAVTGLADGTYRKVYVQIGTAAVEATCKDDGNIHLRLSILGHDGARIWQRDGTPNQARFWLLQFCDGSLFQPLSEEWQSTNP